MDRFLFFFITATTSSLVWPELPGVAILFVLLILGAISIKQRKLALAGLLFGICWMASVGHWQQYLQLPETVFSTNLVVQGKVDTVVKVGDVVRFNLLLDDIVLQKTFSRPEDYATEKFSKTRIRLSWKWPKFIPQQGQTVQLIARLKPPWGLANEAGFNYQNWLFSQNIKATGYVKQGDDNIVLQPAISFRQRMVNHLSLVEMPGTRWILALALGYRGDLTHSDWDVLQQTGTSHLMAISGMHLGMVALWSYVLMAGLLVSFMYLCPNYRHLYVKRLALAGTVIVTFAFMILAGAAVPTQRAWLMILLAFALHYFGINWSVRRFILVSISVFVLLFPLSIFSQSFWLSFGAIVLLWFLFWRFPPPVAGKSAKSASELFRAAGPGKLAYFIKLQFMLSLLMMPLVLFLFGGVSLVAPFINLLAIPMVTFLLLPLALFNLVMFALNMPLANDILRFSSALFEWLSAGLVSLSTFEAGWLNISVASPLACMFLMMAISLFMLPGGLIPKSLLLLLFLPLVTDRAPKVTDNFWQVDILDVGQGLSVLISRNERAILYDTGAAFPGGFNMVESAVLPVLRRRNIQTLDMLILSHSDNDHSGGKEPLLDNMSVSKILTSPGACAAGYEWRWQSLAFNVLWPDWQQDNLITSDNNTSCVIQVTDGENTILLTGDIEARVERYLSHLHQEQRIDLTADVIIAPHHGSKTSSTSDFISSVSPQYGIVSAGFRNRWRMPAISVQSRYSAQNVRLLNTGADGQISVIFYTDEGYSVESWRKDRHKRWYLK